MPVANSHISGFTLKILAILGMTANHFAHIFGGMVPWPVTLVLYCFGGITFPCMAYLLVEGYHYTSDLKKYASRLFLFALVAQVPFTLAFGWGNLPIPRLNVLFTLLISLGMLKAHDAFENRQWLSFLTFVCGVALSYFCDWALQGPILVYLFYILRGKGVWGVILPILFLYAYQLTPLIPVLITQWNEGITSASNAFAQGIAQNYDIYDIGGVNVHFHNRLIRCFANLGYAIVGFIIAGIVLCRYNGKRGRSMKWFFYAYYPAHLIILWAIHEVLTKVL